MAKEDKSSTKGLGLGLNRCRQRQEIRIGYASFHDQKGFRPYQETQAIKKADKYLGLAQRYALQGKHKKALTAYHTALYSNGIMDMDQRARIAVKMEELQAIIDARRKNRVSG